MSTMALETPVSHSVSHSVSQTVAQSVEKTSIPMSIDADYAAVDRKSARGRAASASLNTSLALMAVTVALPVITAVVCRALSATAAGPVAVGSHATFSSFSLAASGLNISFVAVPAVGLLTALGHIVLSRKPNLYTVTAATFHTLTLALQLALIFQGR